MSKPYMPYHKYYVFVNYTPDGFTWEIKQVIQEPRLALVERSTRAYDTHKEAQDAGHARLDEILCISSG